jgi:hypothetical protein
MILLFDDDLVKYNNLRYLPVKIVEIFYFEYDLNRKVVKGRFRLIKKNSLQTLALINISFNLKTTDDPNVTCIFFNLFYFYLIFI